MPEVRQQIAISDGAVKRPAAAAVLFDGCRAGDGRCVRPDDRRGAVSGAARLGAPRGPAGPLRRSRGRRRFRPGGRGRNGGRVVGVRARHRFPRAGRRARGGGRNRRRRPLLGAQARRPPQRHVGACPPLHAHRLSPWPRRLAQRPAVSQPRFAPRLQPAQQPRTPGTLAAHLPPLRPRRIPGRRGEGARRRVVGAAGRSAGARGEAGGGTRRDPRRAGHDGDTARHFTPAHRRGDSRRHRLRRQVRGRQADRPADHRVLRQPPLPRGGEARELRRRIAGLAPGHGGRRGAVQEAHEHAARRKNDGRGRGQLVPREVGRHRGAHLPGPRPRRRGVDELRRLAVHRAQSAHEAGQAGRIAARRAPPEAPHEPPPSAPPPEDKE